MLFNRWIVLFLWCSFAFIHKVAAEDFKFSSDAGAAETAYAFSEHLSEAKVMIAAPQGKILEEGHWTGEHFEFEQFGSKHRIRLSEASFDGEKKKGISLFALKDSVKILRFYRIPPRPTLVLYYGIDDASLPKKGLQHIYLRITVGKKFIRRLRVPIEKGWKETQISLGVVSFLLEPVVVSVDATTDGTEGQFFYLDAHLL